MHSKLGITSFVIALFTVVLAITVAIRLGITQPTLAVAANEFGIFFFSCVASFVLSIVLGIIACCEKNKKRSLSIAALCIDFVAVSLSVAIVIVGINQ